jgi:hypothetical protein
MQNNQAGRESLMRSIFAAVSLLALTAAAYAGDEDVMATRFGNTTVIRDVLGTSRVYYNPDHTFTAASWLGDVSGTWKIENGKICLYAEKKPALYSLKYSNPECDVIELHKIGDKWKQEKGDFELVQGIQK